MNAATNTFSGGHRVALLLPLVVTLLLSDACMVGPKYRRPTAPVPQVYKEPPPAGWKEAQPKDQAVRGKWWEIYNDPELNALEEQVNISNQNVLLAEAQYREARDAVRIARSGLFPTVSTSPSVSRSKPSSTLSPNSTLFVSGTRWDYTLPVDVSYQADVWGSIRRNVRANSALAQASAAQLENARLSFQAELATFYFELHGLDGDQDLLQRTLKLYQDYLDLTQKRFNVGVASGADVAQARTQLAVTRAALIDIGVQRAQFEHAIAILTGKPPAGLSIAPSPLKTPPPVAPVGLPSDLLERRPDIAAAERQAGSANEQIGIAKAAFYPALLFSASGGFETADIAKWFNAPSRFWSLGGQLAETLFDAGKRRAQVDMTEAAYDATVANYRLTVLTAFQQVEDNLAALRVLAEEAIAEDEAVSAAEQALAISTAQYKAGTTDYLQVITSQTAALQAEKSAVDILTRRMVADVLLIEALGGGWDTSKLPNEKQVAARTK
jgi:NodT family efflux transporter outer membrane factor (OMF) lipoprotein